MTARSLVTPTHASTCFFRTSAAEGTRKALVQILEPCNLKCAHCFVSATEHGRTMSLADITNQVIPQLSRARVTRVTLTGGEPFAHPDLMDIVAACHRVGMRIGLCSNATLITDMQIAELARIGAHVNVSLDGFSSDSHGKFRGDRSSFAVTVETTRRLGRAGILQGLLCTPNTLIQQEEYRLLCEFARETGARYVLMNPISSMGRGVKAKDKLASPDAQMRRIAALTAPYGADDALEVVHVRFPNDDKPLAACDAGNIIYVFADGGVTVCPFLVISARTPRSRHRPEEFLVGNVFADEDIAALLDGYDFHARYPMGDNATCASCAMNAGCGKGCPAAVVAAGERIGSVDADPCPITPGRRRLLPLVRP